MESDGDEGGGSDCYSDESEPELEAGCMGVKDPREQKKRQADGRARVGLPWSQDIFCCVRQRKGSLHARALLLSTHRERRRGRSSLAGV